MREALSNYLSLANGITEVTRQRALGAARALVTSGEATAEQIGTLAEDLVETSRGNREVVTSLVRFETDRALGRLGLATNEEVSALTRRIQILEAEVRRLTAAAEVPVTAERTAAAPRARPAKQTAPARPVKRPAAAKAPAGARASSSRRASTTASATTSTGASSKRSARASGTASATRTPARTTGSARSATGSTGSGSARAPRRTTGTAARP